jgi:hypothetical protein
MFRALRNHWRTRNLQAQSGTRRGSGPHRRLGFEQLEERILPANSIFQQLAAGLTAPLTTIQQNVTSALNNASQVPLLNGHLGDATQPLTQGFIQAINSSLQSATSDSQLAGDLASLGAQNVQVTDIGNPATGVQIDMVLSNTVTKPLDFNVALPGLPIQLLSQGGVRLQAGYSYQLDFGYDPNQGGVFFGSGVVNNPNTLSVTAQASVSGSVHVILGILQGNFTDKNQGPSVNASFAASHIGPSSAPSFGVSGAVNLNLHFQTDQIAGLFSASTDFVLDWGVSSQGPPTSLTVAFNNVSVDFGGVFRTTVAPLVHELHDLIPQPVYQLAHLLSYPVPVLSDLWRAIGQKPLTLMDIIAAATNGSLDGLNDVVNLVNDIDQIDKDIQQAQSAATVNLGSFDLAGENQALLTKQAIDPRHDTTDDLTGLMPNNVHGAPVGIGSDDPNVDDFEQKSSSFQLSSPLLDDPTQGIFKILLGQNVPLFEMQGSFSKDAQVKYTFPILGILSVGIQGDLMPNVKFDLGYDTYGMRQFLESGNASDLASGLFVGDDTGIKLDARVGAVASLDIVVASLSVDGGIGGTFSLTVGPSGGTGVERGLTTPQHSQDVYAFLGVELAVGFDTPFGFVGWKKSFDIARLELIGPVPGPQQPVIALPDTDPAVEGATGNPGLPGHLDLLMGPLAQLRNNVGSKSDKDPEDFKVFEGITDSSIQPQDIVDCGGGPNADTVTVRAFGFSKAFSGVTWIDADGGVGENTVVIEPGVKANAYLKGGTGSTSATLTYLGTGQTAPSYDSLLIGGDGINTLTAGPANVIMQGGLKGQLTTISAGSGTNTIFEGTGENDVVFTAPFGKSSIGYAGAGAGSTELEVIGTTPDETINVKRGTSAGLHFDFNDHNGQSLGTLDASGVQDLLITGTSSADNVKIDDTHLAGIGLSTIKVHVDNPGDLGSYWILPQFPTNHVTIIGPANAHVLVTNDGTGQILVASQTSPAAMIPVLVGGELFQLDHPANPETGHTDPGSINPNDYFTFQAGGGDTVLNINPNGAVPLVGNIEFDAGPGTTEFTIGFGEYTINAGDLQNTLIIHANAGSTTIIGDGAKANNNITVEHNAGTLDFLTDASGAGSQATITIDANVGTMRLGGGAARNHNVVDTTITVKTNAGTVQIDSGTDNNVVTVEDNHGTVTFTGRDGSENAVEVDGNQQQGILIIDGGAAAIDTATTFRNLSTIGGTLSIRNTAVTLDDSDETARGPVSLLLFASALDNFLGIPFLFDPTLVALKIITAPLAVVAGKTVNDQVSILSTPAIPVNIAMGPLVVQGSSKQIGHQGIVNVLGTDGALEVQNAATVNVGLLGRVNLGGPLTVFGPGLNLDDSNDTTPRVIGVNAGLSTDGEIDGFGQKIIYDVTDNPLVGLSIEGGPGNADGLGNTFNVDNNAITQITPGRGVVNVYATETIYPDSGSGNGGKPPPQRPRPSSLTVVGGDVVRIQGQAVDSIVAPVFVTGVAGSVGKMIVDSTISAYVATTVTIGFNAALKRGLVRGLTEDRETGPLATYGRITYMPAAVNELDILAATLPAGVGAATFNVNDPGVTLCDLNTGTSASPVNVNKLSSQLILEGNAPGGSITLNGALVLDAAVTTAMAKSRVGSVLAIVDNRTPVAVTGQFQTAGGTPIPDGTTFIAGSVKLQIHYNGNDGDTDAGDAASQDVVLTHLNTPPSVSKLVFAPVENVVSTLSAEIDDPDLADTLTVAVQWGDGQNTRYTLPAGASAFTATHTYPEEIKVPFPVTVSAYDGHGDVHGEPSASIQTTVADAGIAITSVGNRTAPGGKVIVNPVFPTEGAAFNGVVATFTDPGTDGTSRDYTAIITWGDGTTSAGTVIGFGGNVFAVTGSHTYAEEGVYRGFKVRVGDVGGATASGAGIETVLNAPLNIVVPNVTAQEDSIFSGIVAHFTDPGADGSTFDYSAYVAWGGPSATSGGTVVADGHGGFNVMTTFTFGPATGAPFVVTVVVNDHGTQNSGTGQVQLTGRPFTASFVPVTAQAGVRFTGAVATFRDPGAGSGKTATGYFTATITWGDGAITTGSIVRASSFAPFTVVASHAYADIGDFPVTVTIDDRDGTAAVAKGTAHVSLARFLALDFDAADQFGRG